MKILLIEDDAMLVAQVRQHLEDQNFVVEVTESGELGWDYAQVGNYDLILLDVHLPDGNGIALCQRLRQTGYEGAILLQTAEADSDRKVGGLDAGADDYVVKPYTLNELSARIRALLRRPHPIADVTLHWGLLRLNTSTCIVTYNQQPVQLSPKEFNLLELLMRNPQWVFSSSVLLERVWLFDESPGEEAVRTLVKRLRQKLKQAGATAVIENVYGMGYRLHAAVAAVEPTQPSLAEQARHAASNAIENFQTLITERLAVIEQATMAQPLSHALQQQARQAAHKLAGSLDMFGVPHGSRYSRQIEAALAADGQSFDHQQLSTLVNQLQRALKQTLPTGVTPDPADRERTRRGEAADSTPLFVVVSKDLAWVNPLQSQAPSPWRVIHQEQLPLAAPDWTGPTVLLLDLDTVSPPGVEESALDQRLAAYPGLPMLVVTQRNSFEIRQAVARHGSCMFLPRTLGPDQILGLVQEALQRQGKSPLRTLLVDDDQLMLQVLQHQLDPWRIEVTGLFCKNTLLMCSS